jgi:hypothetical protein
MLRQELQGLIGLAAHHEKRAFTSYVLKPVKGTKVRPVRSASAATSIRTGIKFDQRKELRDGAAGSTATGLFIAPHSRRVGTGWSLQLSR